MKSGAPIGPGPHFGNLRTTTSQLHLLRSLQGLQRLWPQSLLSSHWTDLVRPLKTHFYLNFQTL